MAQINTPKGAVVPFNSNVNYGLNGIMPGNLPSVGIYGKSQDAATAYNEWKLNYTETCSNGIRVKSDDPSFTLSEGIGYGMLLAAYSADKNLFDGLYKYFKSNLDSNGLMNWKTEGCAGASGNNSATNADLDIAFSLLIAKNQWPTYNSPYKYENEALILTERIRQLEIDSLGEASNGDGWELKDDCRNISYQSPAYYKTFALNNPGKAVEWNNAVSGAYTLITANSDASTGLVSDWSDTKGKMNTCNPGGLGYPASAGYGYDACRTLLRLTSDFIWNGDPAAKNILQKISTYVDGKSAPFVGGPLYKNGTNYPGWSHNAAFVSTFSVAGMASNNQALLNAMYAETVKIKDKIQNTTASGYYGNTLRCLSLFMMTGNFWKFGTTSEQEINVITGATNIISDSTYNFGYTQIVSGNTNGKFVKFKIENLGFNKLQLGPSPVVSLSCGADFKIESMPSFNSLNLSDTVSFLVYFKPETIGSKACVLSITSNDRDEGSYRIKLAGVGTKNPKSPRINLLDTINVITTQAVFNFGSFNVSNPGYKLLKVTNTGDTLLNLTSMNITGAGFTIIDPVNTNISFVIPAKSSRLLTLGFNSITQLSNSTGTFSFTTDDAAKPTYNIQLLATTVNCSQNPGSKILWDFDGNKNIIQPFAPIGQWTTDFPNTFKNGTNPSPLIARYGRPKAVDNDVIRFYNCRARTVFTSWPPITSQLPPFAFNADNATLRMFIFSPAAGVEVKVSPKKPDPSASLASPRWLPVASDFSSDVIRTTTKSNQWELLIFDLSKTINNGLAPDIRVLDIMIDPTRKYASLASIDTTKRIFYLDRILYGQNPCLLDGSGVLDDYDTHINIYLDKDVPPFTELVPNPVVSPLNNSENVAKFVKSSSAQPLSDVVLYHGCSNKLNFSRRKYMSMLVYSPFEGKQIQLIAKLPDGPDADNAPDNAAIVTQVTTKANKWERIYFDFVSVSAKDIPNVFGFDIVIDPTVNPSQGVYYIDDIRTENGIPCVSNITSTGILNDFNVNRNIDLAYSPLGTYNDEAVNPSLAGNSSSGVMNFVRDEDGDPIIAGLQPDPLRFKACGTRFDLTKGRSVFSLQLLAHSDSTEVILSLLKSNGTEIGKRNAIVKKANTWETLSFDFSDYIGDTTAVFLDIILDPSNVKTSSQTLRTYYLDNIRYTNLPKINLKQSDLNILPGDTLDFGSVLLDDSISLDITVLNNGGSSLILSGTGKNAVKISGIDSVSFIKKVTPQFTSIISKTSATGFTVVFKPGTGGDKLSVLTIKSNDPDIPIYNIYLKAKSLCPKIALPTVIKREVFYCVNDKANSLNATPSPKGILKWHTDSLGATSSDTAFVPLTTISGKTTRYVSQVFRGCESSRIPIVITVHSKPVVSVSQDLEVCRGTGVTLIVKGADTYLWTDGPANDTNQVITLSDTRYRVKAIDTTTTCSDTASVLVKVKPIPEISISGITSICRNSGSILIASGADIYQWTEGPANDTFIVNPLKNKMFIVTGTDTSTSCSDTASVLVSIKKCPLPLPKPALLGVWVCSGEKAILIARGINGGSLYWFTKPSGGIPSYFGDSVSIDPINTNTSYYVQDSLEESGSDRVEVSVKIVNEKLRILGNKNICSGQVSGLAYSVSPQTPGLKYTWNVTGDASVSGNTEANLNLGSNSDVTLSVVPLSSAGSKCMMQEAILLVKKSFEFSNDVKLEVSEDTVCEDDEISVSILNIPRGTTVQWRVPNGAFVSFTDPTDSTKAKIKFGEKGGGISVRPGVNCLDADSVRRNVVVIEKPEVFAGEDQYYEGISDAFVLNGKILNMKPGMIYSSQWYNLQATSSITNSNQLSTTVLPKDPVNTYVLIVSQKQDQCFDSDTVNVSFKWSLKPPLIFSPNEDDKNDFWVIPDIVYFPDAKIEIFNQWGTVVYTKNRNYHLDPWNGKSNAGHSLSVATYYYIISLNFRDYKPLAGSVTIVR